MRMHHPVSVVGIHYSAADGIKHIDPSRSGSTTPEHGRLLRAVGKGAPRIEQKVSFYVRSKNGKCSRESIICGNHAYEAHLDNIYDVMTDPDNIIERAVAAQQMGDWDAVIGKILRAGYAGVMIDGLATASRVVTIYGRSTIPVKQLF